MVEKGLEAPKTIKIKTLFLTHEYVRMAMARDTFLIYFQYCL